MWLRSHPTPHSSASRFIQGRRWNVETGHATWTPTLHLTTGRFQNPTVFLGNVCFSAAISSHAIKISSIKPPGKTSLLCLLDSDVFKKSNKKCKRGCARERRRGLAVGSSARAVRSVTRAPGRSAEVTGVTRTELRPNYGPRAAEPVRHFRRGLKKVGADFKRDHLDIMWLLTRLRGEEKKKRWSGVSLQQRPLAQRRNLELVRSGSLGFGLWPWTGGWWIPPPPSPPPCRYSGLFYLAVLAPHKCWWTGMRNVAAARLKCCCLLPHPNLIMGWILDLSDLHAVIIISKMHLKISSPDVWACIMPVSTSLPQTSTDYMPTLCPSGATWVPFLSPGLSSVTCCFSN